MRHRSYSSFLRKLHKSAKDNGYLLRVMFELTYRCNFRCRHCYIPQSYFRYGELKTESIFSILDQLAEAGCFYLGFTGGEPFIREDIMDILWYAKRKGFEIIIHTNGSLIDKKRVDELSDIHPNKIDITIPAMSRHIFENITQASGSYEKVFRAISSLRDKGVGLGLKTCVLRENEVEIKKIQEFAASLGVMYRLGHVLFPCLDGSKEPYRYRAGQVMYAKRMVRDCAMDRHQETLFRCGVGVSQAAISPLGELKMCLMIQSPLYKIGESSLKDCWEKLKKMVKDIDINLDREYSCSGCNLKGYCRWCPARGWLENKRFITCTPDSQLRG